MNGYCKSEKWILVHGDYELSKSTSEHIANTRYHY